MRMHVVFALLIILVLALWASNTALVEATSQASPTLVLNWYDQTGSFSLDNIHISNPNAGGALALVTLNGTSKSVSIPAFGDAYVNFPGMAGGPVFISSGANLPLVASQRVFYNNSFSEVYAVPSSCASTQLILNWYDQKDPGFILDNIHLANPNGTAATATVTLGQNTKTVTVPANGAAYVGFPGSVGGPVFITASSLILASARTIYNQSFNEVNAVPLAAGCAPVNQASTALEFSWYDQTGGFSLDNIHIGNPYGGSANVVVSLAGVGTQTVTVPPQGEVAVNFGSQRSGPVLITSNSPVIASQRVFYNNSFSEVYANRMDSASGLLLLSWYDQKDTGFASDNIHIYNTLSTQQTVLVHIGSPGLCQPSTDPLCKGGTIPPFQELIVNFPGQVGGPVYIMGEANSLLASARTQYAVFISAFQVRYSFNEVNAVPIQ